MSGKDTQHLTEFEQGLPSTRVLSIDPGYNNGWCIFTYEDPRWPLWETSGTAWYSDLEDIINKQFVPWGPNVVLIERLPPTGIGPHSQLLATIVARLARAFPTATYILPGTWKPVTGHRSLPPGLNTWTPHERDAIRMAMYYLIHVTSPKG